MGHRTFSEMLEAIKQHRDGLVSDAELIFVLQCDEFQLSAVRQYNALPPTAAAKCSLADFDDAVNTARCKAYPGREIPVTDLEISTRLANILLKNNVQTLNEITWLSVEELMKFPNMGSHFMQELREVLHARGLTFAAPKVSK